MKETNHRLLFNNSQNMHQLKDESINLIVTSPPYPMIEMWDNLFSNQNTKIEKLLKETNGKEAFELMHRELDQVWTECYRILKNGSFLCINIGDATRKIGDDFRLYSNHFRILQSCHQIGFDILPVILWRKQTNAPNKFMGSGMLPAGAYVTLEHEYILILRKGSKREFKDKVDKEIRQESAFFWEERNNWFSDIWDFKGIKQQLTNGKTRNRSAAYPFELAYRLINMYSVKGDTILDPFLGTGTTTIASIASERNSIGFDIDSHFREEILTSVQSACQVINQYIKERLEKHLKFVRKYQSEKKLLKYENELYKFPVMTKQEVNLKLNYVKELSLKQGNTITALYSDKEFQEIFSSINFTGYKSNSNIPKQMELVI